MTTLEGLSTAEAVRLAREHGPNTLPKPPRPSIGQRFLTQFANPLIYILLFALALDLVLWFAEQSGVLPFEGIAIGVILLLNATLGVWQERKAEHALERLAALAAPRVWARRDGAFVELAADALVPGDLVRLEAGDRVPADVTLAAPTSLAIDESILTGESLPVEKVEGDEAFAGTLLVRGHAMARVARTGPKSAMGQLATMLGTLETEATPLERRLKVFGNKVARWVLVLAAVIAVGGVLSEGTSHLGQVLLFAVALAVAAVPEGLPAILALTLALGVERMAKRRAVVRKLAAVEALGSVTVIATDKTGTLTENRMEVRDIDAVDREGALQVMVIANDAEPGAEIGDPLDVALLAFAERNGIDVAASQREFQRVSVIPFDSTTKMMRVDGRHREEQHAFIKGAPEVLLDRCALDERAKAEWLEKLEAYAAGGYRLLGLARGETGSKDGWQWLGVVLLWDPPRPEVPDAVARARAAGLRVAMVTGDHPATAVNVARLVGIDAEQVVTGSELDALDAQAFSQRVRSASIFARVDPHHKLKIVKTLQASGDIVAVTGDGVNDAPALKQSDVGVAMGQRGSDVAREVADLVLLDDNFATIVAAIEEGRSIYENIQKFIRFLFSTNMSEVLLVSVGAFAAFLLNLRDEVGALLLPLTAAQLLWINLVTDGAPALALGVDRNPDVMSRPPRDPHEPLLDRRSLQFVLVSGGAKAVVAGLILAGLPTLFGQSMYVTQTCVFLFMAAGQILFAYPARWTELRPPPNAWVHVAVVVSFGLQLLVVVVPGLMEAFDTVMLTPTGWLTAGAGVMVSLVIAMTTSRMLYGAGSSQRTVKGRARTSTTDPHSRA